MNKKINDSAVPALQKILQDNPWAKDFFRWAALRTNNTQSTAIDRIETKTGIGYYDVISLMKMLEREGLVRFIAGRKGHKSRVEWNFSIKSIGEAALGETVSLGAVGDDDDEEDGDEDFKDNIQHSYTLRPGLTVTISLPADFTQKEAERLSSFIQTLPFEE